MQISITGRHLEIEERVRKYAEDRAQRLPHYFDKVSRVEVVIDREGGDFTCEIHVSAEGHEEFVRAGTGADRVHRSGPRQGCSTNDWKSRQGQPSLNHHQPQRASGPGSMKKS